ncbi:MAG: DsrE family protein [Lautropia sp.]
MIVAAHRIQPAPQTRARSRRRPARAVFAVPFLAVLSAALLAALAPATADAQSTAAQTAAAPAAGTPAATPIKVVYHLTNGVAEAARAVRNIRNHLNADSSVQISVVTNGPGIDFLLEDAKTPNGTPFAGPIGELANRGVKFFVCQNTLTTREIAKDRVVMEASIVPSGVAEAARLQVREGYAYLRP